MDHRAQIFEKFPDFTEHITFVSAFAVSAFVRNLDALVLFCEEQVNECSDPICTYVLRLNKIHNSY